MDRVCVVAGVGEGTGAALARRFARGGYCVALLSRDEARLAALATELDGAYPFVVDLADLDRLVDVCRSVTDVLTA